MEARLLERAETAQGFMPPDEGLALHEAGLAATTAVPGAPLVEIGSWCGKSGIYLGAAARAGGTVLLAVDHHRGSEENQTGWEHHDPDVVDANTGLIDTLPLLRSALHEAGVERHVVVVVGRSPVVARYWNTPLAFCFIDGGHGVEPARHDFEGWAGHVAPGGTLAIHDVFPDPTDGGRPPYEEIYLPALAAGFEERSATGSLRVLTRVSRRAREG